MTCAKHKSYVHGTHTAVESEYLQRRYIRDEMCKLQIPPNILYFNEKADGPRNEVLRSIFLHRISIFIRTESPGK